MHDYKGCNRPDGLTDKHLLLTEDASAHVTIDVRKQHCQEHVDVAAQCCCARACVFDA